MNKQNNFFKKICPECFFEPSYPQEFKFCLIKSSKNYGELRVRIEKGLEISELTGDKTALAKIEEIGRKQANNAFYCLIPCADKHFISYPFKNALELTTAIAWEGDVEKNAGLNDLRLFVSNVMHPVNERLFYEKTGMRIER